MWHNWFRAASSYLLVWVYRYFTEFTLRMKLLSPPVLTNENAWHNMSEYDNHFNWYSLHYIFLNFRATTSTYDLQLPRHFSLQQKNWNLRNLSAWSMQCVTNVTIAAELKRSCFNKVLAPSLMWLDTNYLFLKQRFALPS